MTRRTRSQYDFPNLRFDETILTKHFTAPRQGKIKFVVVHHMTIVGKGNGSALDACYKTWQTREASAHYGVDGDYVRQFVWDGNAAWSTASKTGNHQGISIEHANATAGPGWTVSETTWKTGAKLAAAIHRKYGLGRPTSNSKGTTGTLRVHRSFFATACPGPYMMKIWSAYVREAQRQYDQMSVNPALPKPPANQVVRWKQERYLNMHGDDGKTGTRTFFARLPRMVEDLTKGLPDIVSGCEVRDGEQAKALTRALNKKGYFGHVKDGNFLFALKHVAWGYAGSYELPAAVQGEGRKEALFRGRLSVNGVFGHHGVSHLDYRDGAKFDTIRVRQAKAIVTAMERFATRFKLKYWKSRTVISMDDNSISWVKDKAMKPAGFKAAIKVKLDGQYTGNSRPILRTRSILTDSDHPIIEVTYGRNIK